MTSRGQQINRERRRSGDSPIMPSVSCLYAHQLMWPLGGEVVMKRENERKGKSRRMKGSKQQKER